MVFIRNKELEQHLKDMCLLKRIVHESGPFSLESKVAKLRDDNTALVQEVEKLKAILNEVVDYVYRESK